MTTAIDPAAPTPQAGSLPADGTATGPSRRRRGVWAMVLVLLLAAALLVAWVVDRWTHVFVDDARIAAHLVTVSSEVAGRIVHLPVVAGEAVRKGQLLAAIDAEDATLEIVSLDAQLAGLDAQQRQLRAEQAMVNVQTSSRIAAGSARITSAEAAHGSSTATLERARSTLARVRHLAEHRAMSQQELDDARAALGVAQQQERLAIAEIERARADLLVVRSEQAQVTVLERRIEMLAAQKAALAAQRRQRQADLGRREIRAEFDGVLDVVFIDPGEYVAAGSRLLLYHDPARIWIDANVKETQFARLRLGALAKVRVDAYPDIAFEARVERLGGAATSLFALLPSPNPSGNFTKITQRLPMRLSIAQQEDRLRPGMMVELRIDVD